MSRAPRGHGAAFDLPPLQRGCATGSRAPGGPRRAGERGPQSRRTGLPRPRPRPAGKGRRASGGRARCLRGRQSPRPGALARRRPPSVLGKCRRRGTRTRRGRAPRAHVLPTGRAARLAEPFPSEGANTEPLPYKQKFQKEGRERQIPCLLQDL